MVFVYELKKIWRRISPLLLLIVLLGTSIITMAITLIFFNHAPESDPNIATKYTALATRINTWENGNSHTTTANAFQQFYADYKTMNASTLNGTNLVTNYNTAKNSFNNFYTNCYQKYIYPDGGNKIADYLLVQTKYISRFNTILTNIDIFFNEEYTTNEAIISGLKTINPTWDDSSLSDILENLFFVQIIDSSDLSELKSFITKYPTGTPNYDYTDAYNYLVNRYWISIANSSTYTGKLSQYEGFSDYSDSITSTRVCQLANYRLEHSTEEYATPFTFGNIFNSSEQISLFDFVFTNLELATIPLILLVLICTACVFFTDAQQNTLITTVAINQNRRSIIITKMLAVMLYAVSELLILIGIYITFGLIFFRAYISPDILFLFNGTTPVVMSALNYFTIYCLNMIFKLLPLIAICGLFSFVKTKPFVIVGLTMLTYLIVTILNYCLGGFWFYQFIPFLGLDPIRYFGTQLLFTTMPSSYNIWYTLPTTIGIDIILYGTLVYIFKRHDF